MRHVWSSTFFLLQRRREDNTRMMSLFVTKEEGHASELSGTRNQRGWSANHLSPLTQKLYSRVPRTCGLMTSGTDNFPSQSNWANFKAGKFLKSEAPLWYVLLLGFANGVGGKSTSFFFRHGSIITTPSGSQVKSSSLFLYYPSHSSVVIQGTNG